VPRIRTIKPEAFKSESLSSVSVLARWTFAGLWTYCDDEGRGRSDPRLVKAELFPIDDKTTLSNVRAVLDELEQIGAICRYEVANRGYLHCPKWTDHQKVSHPTKSKFPECPKQGLTCTLEGNESPPEIFVSPPESLAPEQGTGNREQGVGKTGAKRATQLPEDFAPNDSNIQLAVSEGVDLRREFNKFCDHNRAKGSTYKDWNLALNNWIRRAAEYGNVRPMQRPTAPSGEPILPRASDDRR
jgi:hypothetical protein